MFYENKEKRERMHGSGVMVPWDCRWGAWGQEHGNGRVVSMEDKGMGMGMEDRSMVWMDNKEEVLNSLSCLGVAHRNKKCKEVATEEFLKGRLVLLLEIERPHSKSHVFSKQSVFYFIKLSALFFSPLMLYFIFYPSLLFLPACLGRFLYVMSSLFWLFFGRCMVSSVAPSLLFIFRWCSLRFCILKYT